MSRSSTAYADGGLVPSHARGLDVTTPVAGHYRFRMGSGSVKGAIRLWFGPPSDPVTGEQLDRSWRWQAEFDGELVDFDRVWPACAREPIPESEYRALIARRQWAREHVPQSSYAHVGRRHDHLDSANPLPF